MQFAALDLPRELRQHIWELAAPAALEGRVAEGRPLPAVSVVGGEDRDEQLVACVQYALGLEGGGGWYEGEGPAPKEGMVKELFVGLCEYMVQKWYRRKWARRNV